MSKLYTLSFVFFVLLTGLAVVASGFSIVVQARLTKGPAANWNVLIVVGSYVALALISCIIWLSRRRHSAKRLRAIPKAFMPTKDGDVPKQVVRLVANEYDRASYIAYVSLPKGAQHPGWGRPGTEYEGISFRREIPATFQTIAATAQKLLPSLPAPSPFVRPAAYLLPLARLVKMVDQRVWQDVERYSELVENCRYAGPPSEETYKECMRCVGEITRVFDTIQLVLTKEGQSAVSILTGSEWTSRSQSQDLDEDSGSTATASERRNQ
ncbi:hypothetical protein RhiJN_18557 [Ceratobasidium sp. AG-Ba]|nr:hypothetical protein RhiJN_18557 [Ceratobasidium sp. AG-Ba]